MGDDELILGHRASEWCGHAPILEEDIAFANLALDEIGHAALWYGALAGLAGEDPDRYPDRLVFFRQPAQFRNAQLVELPNGDWAFTILRQYLFDAAELAALERLKESRYPPLAERAAKIWKEEIYHHRHTQAWATRLALGTEDSHRRMQNALDLAWPYTAQLFASLPGEGTLVEAGFCPPGEAMRAAWSEEVLPFLGKCELILPEVRGEPTPRDRHTDHFKELIAEMQSVAREEPEAEW
jgi:ring-1,2-phenylacetyl-CoA epoxidase subunit PaaC